MTSPDDGDSLQQPAPYHSKPQLYVPKNRSLTKDEPPQTSSASLAIRSSSPTISARPGPLARALSRSQSPNGRRSLSVSRLGRSPVASSLGNVPEGDDDIRALIVRSFAPTVAVYASEDTDLLLKQKGLSRGLVDLVRPFGERVSGKVVVRDSVGASRAWDDFRVHFVNLADLSLPNINNTAPSLESLEELLQEYLEQSQGDPDEDIGSIAGGTAELSPYYRLLLTRLLTSRIPSSHEAFLHPASCVIAISSHTPTPIETLRTLYAQTAHGNRTLPSYASPEYLRYYILIHDEDASDFSKSAALFDQMKRHFGLHCHLLRLRSIPCTPTDDDAVELPICEWLSPQEDISQLQQTDSLIELASTVPTHIYQSDVQAIRTFVRELVAQSVVPHMESRIALLNEQVASRRRGISGRFMSLSKRWAGTTGFGARTASPAAGGASTGSGNYDAIQGYYRHDTPEAQLRKMADYAFMLRDYKLAASTYELLKTDFTNDKAWRYLAGANEMTVIASLLNPLTNAGVKGVRIEEVEKGLETAVYSYVARSSDVAGALRAIMLAVELLKVRGRAADGLATKWGLRALEVAGALGQVGRILISERIAGCYADQVVMTGQDRAWGWGRRKRKAGMWSVMVADEWMKLGRTDGAGRRMEEAARFYEEAYQGQTVEEDWHRFREMHNFMQQLQIAVTVKRGHVRRRGLSEAEKLQVERAEEEEAQRHVFQTTEQLDRPDMRGHRRSLMGPANPFDATAPLSPVRLSRPDPLSSRDEDDFE